MKQYYKFEYEKKYTCIVELDTSNQKSKIKFMTNLPCKLSINTASDLYQYIEIVSEFQEFLSNTEGFIWDLSKNYKLKHFRKYLMSNDELKQYDL